MNIYNIIEVIKHSEQRGQELMIDALIIGLEIGRKNVKNIHDVVQIIESLKKLKGKTDLGIYSPFLRIEIFDDVLNQNEKLDDRLLNLQLEFQRQSKLKQLSNCCQICNQNLEENSVENFKASCKHQFHKQCIIPFLNQGVCELSFFKCPLCGHQNLQQEIQKLIKGNQHVQKSCCPNAYCKKQFLFLGQEIYRCTQCKKKYCLKCQSQNHPLNQCKNQTKYIKFEMGDNYKECPKCKQYWVKQIKEENMLQCQCRYSFCFGCGQKDCCCNKFRIFQTFRSLKRQLTG